MAALWDVEKHGAMIGRIIIAGYFLEPCKAEIHLRWIWIGIRPMKMALLWTGLAVRKDCGKAESPTLDARDDPGGRGVHRGRKQQIIDLRNRVLSPIPVGPLVLRRGEPVHHIYEAGISGERKHWRRKRFIIEIADHGEQLLIERRARKTLMDDFSDRFCLPFTHFVGFLALSCRLGVYRLAV